MNHKSRILSLFLLVALIIAGCGQVVPPEADRQPDILNPLACSPYISMDETIRLLKSNGRLAQSQWATAGAIAKAESSLCVSAVHYNTDGSVDRGLYQINSVHGYSTDCVFNAACNTDAAMNIYRMQGWNAWTVYRTGAYQQYLSEAQAAVNRVAGGSTGGTVTGTTANTSAYTGPYNLRSGPGTSFGVVGSVGGGVQVSIVCQANGTTHTGPWGSTNIWDKLSTGKWISDAFVYTGSNNTVAPRCS